MCGIAGFWHPGGLHAAEAHARAWPMAEALQHRGPDDQGIMVDEEAGLILAHRRLAIIDVTREGHQPMRSASGRYAIVFNGELYNFRELRTTLAGRRHVFRGRSDTEVLLAAVEEWGVTNALPQFNGMFAFALWDFQNRTLVLARDRLGEKPLYYGWIGGSFVFASELKALRVYPGFAADIDRDALALFLRHGYIAQPWSIYRGIRKLPPASMLSMQSASQAPEIRCYWSPAAMAESGTRAPLRERARELTDRLEALLADAVRLRMQSDVPLGAFLSGGIDSSAVVALMQRESSKPVCTFSIGFHDQSYDEAGFAARVARHLGTDHTELYVTPADAIAVIPKLPSIYDEPFADSSQIPTFLVSQLARSTVTVSLSGDGGDELFGGYNRYRWAPRLWNTLAIVPFTLRAAAAKRIQRVPLDVWQSLSRSIERMTPSRIRPRTPVLKILKMADWLTAESREDLYRGMNSLWQAPASVVIDGREPLTVITDSRHWARVPDYASWMMYLDMIGYLPDDILVKLDRATMAVSLEGRVPFLDHRVVEFAWQVPQQFKSAAGESKWLLRQVLYRHVPRHLVQRPKMGFATPIGEWLRTSLRDWVEALLSEERLRSEGYFLARPIRRMWDEHLTGRRDWQFCLWNVLMFQSWLETSRADCLVPMSNEVQ